MRQAAPNYFYRTFIKAPADIMIAAIAIVTLSPLMMVLYLVLYRSTRGDVIFTQTRIGMGEREFKAYKFRTMSNERGPDGELLPDAQRLTRIGKFIRKTSLDELPQLFNILRGDMSFVGPRPLLPEYLPYYNEVQHQRHLVMPGITGLAQINGRNLTTWEKRFEFDVRYVNSISFILDIRILLLTVLKVLRSEGISAEGHATMPKFSEYIEQKKRQ
jgi:lipopolysaccharide/colanic/teichoic acid biosynthesis glycosyltransferase